MKLSFKILQFLLSALILIQASLMQIALPELVICFGEDGHVAIERDDCPDCGHPLNVTEEVALTGKYDDQHHFGCTDFSLDLHHGTPLIKDTQKLFDTQAISRVNSAFNIADVQTIDLNRIPHPGSFQHPKLNFIRTTILII